MSRLQSALHLIIALLLAGTSDAVELLAPVGDVAVKEDHLVLVGRSGAEYVTVELDGARLDPVPVEDGYFHFLLELNVGLHEVRVGDSGVAETVGIRILAGPRIDRSYESTFIPYQFHGTKPREQCSRCHEPVGSDFDVATLTGWCMDCHPDVPVKFTRHGDGALESCESCHRVGSDLTLVSARAHADVNPCYGCHQDKISEFAQEYVHGPVAGGACTICHDPHGSDFANTLVQPAGLLCLSCHEDLDPARYAVEHQPFVNGQCVDCHDPHATRNRWVLRRSSEQLCFPCHGVDGEIPSHQHPYNVKPRSSLEIALPLTEGGRLECLSCHEAHGGSKQYLLRSPTYESCIGCHPRH